MWAKLSKNSHLVVAEVRCNQLPPICFSLCESILGWTVWDRGVSSQVRHALRNASYLMRHPILWWFCPEIPWRRTCRFQRRWHREHLRNRNPDQDTRGGPQWRHQHLNVIGDTIQPQIRNISIEPPGQWLGLGLWRAVFLYNEKKDVAVFPDLWQHGRKTGWHS